MRNAVSECLGFTYTPSRARLATTRIPGVLTPKHTQSERERWLAKSASSALQRGAKKGGTRHEERRKAARDKQSSEAEEAQRTTTIIFMPKRARDAPFAQAAHERRAMSPALKLIRLGQLSCNDRRVMFFFFFFAYN